MTKFANMRWRNLSRRTRSKTCHWYDKQTKAFCKVATHKNEKYCEEHAVAFRRWQLSRKRK